MEQVNWDAVSMIYILGGIYLSIYVMVKGVPNFTPEQKERLSTATGRDINYLALVLTVAFYLAWPITAAVLFGMVISRYVSGPK